MGGGSGLDDWDLSPDQLDFLEQDAIRQIAARSSNQNPNRPASSYPTSPAGRPAASLRPRADGVDPCSPSRFRQPDVPGNNVNQNINSSPLPNRTASYPNSPLKPTSLQQRIDRVDPCSPSRFRQPDIPRNNGERPKVLVRLSVHATGAIAASFPYNQVLVDAFRKVPKAIWNSQEKKWMFPPSSLRAAEEILGSISAVEVEVNKLEPLVQRALSAASSVKDLRDLYGRLSSDIESKLLPFQREGVRFALQHGARVLIADEMGLGKTLQAIAVAACLNDMWPVLVISPSSLRLHWASVSIFLYLFLRSVYK